MEQDLKRLFEGLNIKVVERYVRIAVAYAVEFLKKRRLTLPVINDIVENAK